jgi:hypothetical protein
MTVAGEGAEIPGGALPDNRGHPGPRSRDRAQSSGVSSGPAAPSCSLGSVIDMRRAPGSATC